VHGGRASFINWYQQVPDQGQIVRQYMRWDHKLASYDNPGTVITRACQVMLSEPQGPGYLAIGSVGTRKGRRTITTQDSASPGTSIPSQKLLVPSRMARGSSRNCWRS